MSDESNNINEPFSNSFQQKKITVFKSLEDQENYHILQMAERTPEESYKVLIELQRIFLKDYILPDGTWKPIERIITIKKPFK